MSKLEGAKRAAVLLLQLGEAAAAEVLASLSEEEARSIKAEMSTFTEVTPAQANQVLASFEKDSQHASLATSTPSTPGNIHTNQPHPPRASATASAQNTTATPSTPGLSMPKPPAPENVLTYLRQYSPQALAQFLTPEQPQVIAIVLGALKDPVYCAQVLEALPNPLGADVYQRWNSLKNTQRSWVQEIQTALRSELATSPPTSPTKQRPSPLKQAEEKDATGSAFEFNDLLKINPQGLGYLLNKVDLPVLASAMQLAEPVVQHYIWQNLPTRNTSALKHLIRQLPPQSLATIEQDQTTIASMAHTLVLQGKIMVLQRQKRTPSTQHCH